MSDALIIIYIVAFVLAGIFSLTSLILFFALNILSILRELRGKSIRNVFQRKPNDRLNSYINSEYYYEDSLIKEMRKEKIKTQKLNSKDENITLPLSDHLLTIPLINLDGDSNTSIKWNVINDLIITEASETINL